MEDKEVYMLVDVKLMINGKELKTQIEIDETVLDSIQSDEAQSDETVDRGYKKQMESYPYLYVDDCGKVETESDMEFEEDDLRFMIANYYTSERVAQNNARADQLMRQLRRFAVENRKDKIDWNDGKKYKYNIYYSYPSQKIDIDFGYNCRYFEIYFDSYETAERAIKEFKDELIWYFTEYKDSL